MDMNEHFVYTSFFSGQDLLAIDIWPRGDHA